MMTSKPSENGRSSKVYDQTNQAGKAHLAGYFISVYITLIKSPGNYLLGDMTITGLKE